MQIRHDTANSRFETDHEEPATLAYQRLRDGTLDVRHTNVPSNLEGQGIAGQLVEEVIAFARAEGVQIIPTCRFVKGWLHRHPEAQDLVVGNRNPESESNDTGWRARA